MLTPHPMPSGRWPWAAMWCVVRGAWCMAPLAHAMAMAAGRRDAAAPVTSERSGYAAGRRAARARGRVRGESAAGGA
jgi:hypothetical protein